MFWKYQLLHLLLFCGNSLSAQMLKLWYDKPATRFEEALLLGNGRLGVMVYGGINNETLNSLHHSSINIFKK